MNFSFLDKERADDLDFVSGLLSRRFRVKSIARATRGASGNFVYELNGDTIVKFPSERRKLDARRLEQKLLWFLDGKITAAVPRPDIAYLRRGSVFRRLVFPVYWYPKIEGDYIAPECYGALPARVRDAACADMARFFSEMHVLTGPARMVRPPGIYYYLDLSELYCHGGSGGRYDARSLVDKMVSAIRADESFSYGERIRLARILKKAALSPPPRAIQGIKVFGHFDIQPANVLFDSRTGRMTGVFDFGSTNIGNIYYDFYKPFLRGYGRSFVENMVGAYMKMTGVKVNVGYIFSINTMIPPLINYFLAPWPYMRVIYRDEVLDCLENYNTDVC